LHPFFARCLLNARPAGAQCVGVGDDQSTGLDCLSRGRDQILISGDRRLSGIRRLLSNPTRAALVQKYDLGGVSLEEYAVREASINASQDDFCFWRDADDETIRAMGREQFASIIAEKAAKFLVNAEVSEFNLNELIVSDRLPLRPANPQDDGPLREYENSRFAKLQKRRHRRRGGASYRLNPLRTRTPGYERPPPKKHSRRSRTRYRVRRHC
jgi:hypothetical protein